jgi:long-chain acyl-CoA synthetase
MELDADGLVVRPAPRPLPGGPASVAAVLRPVLAIDPHREALVGRSGRFSYRALDDVVDAAAVVLQQRGVRAGDRAAVSLPNDVDIVIAFLAVMRIGGIWVGVNRALALPEKAHILRDCDPVVLLDEDARDAWRSDVDAALGARPRFTDVDPHAPAAIAYTSGTTGFPKGAVHSQHNMLWPGVDGRENDPAPPDERHGVLLPLTLLNLQILGPLFAFLKGTTCVCVDRSDPVGLAAWIREERITRITAVPAVLHDLISSPDVDAPDLVTLRRPECGGAATPHAFRERFRARFGTDVLTGYGLTEAPTAVTREMPGDELLAGCSGRPFAPVGIVIVDEADREVPTRCVGEICIRARDDGPWAGVYTPFLGYWRRPEATRRALRGGVLHTDDLGSVDDAGRLFVQDRRGDVIVRGGANVYPAEVERVLQEHPSVVAAAVIGVPEERLGEQVLAFVQRRDGDEVDADALAAFCRDRLARYKVPQHWRFVDAFPRTPMGKIRKAELRAREVIY